MIHTRGLARSFKAKKTTVEAVKGVDIDVNEGELVAFLGPNGAGKSTTLRMLTTLLRPTRGSARVAGHDVLTDPLKVRQNIGYIGQGNSAGHAHRVLDELVSQGSFYGMPRAKARVRGTELLAALDLSDLAKRAGMTLSGGQRRRVDIALGMMHHPRLLFLDEPSTGLDPQNRANLADEIRRLRSEFGMTIFLTTHYLEEADQLAERVLIIDHGAVIASGTPSELKATLAGDRIDLGFAEADTAATAAARCEGFAGVKEVTLTGTRLNLAVGEGESTLPRLLRHLDADGITVTTANVHIPTLDDVFLALTGRTLRDEDEG
ncbi:ATP-binding cassette domain-containing protein [Stackebrandtia nassauensis]|uniref:ABC transporter related protein n=1 Tax=Stackebrandtia nassauensis (strain DSM 44728 / CIP 108903 / NRRL B-16338 / NBRC 102104 / LLR-40K-21) TaxID=446470 RepID=D3PVA0_STANL|nr:ATP-binding cassette domain-containing protein [Stackebrandtia nassauensis]ADD41153.1 ABC transporter related protein [Stackebrandtia nassauensis DSM 44728]